MNNRRKKFLIDATVQGALARRIVIHWIIFCALVVTIMPFCQLLYNFRADLSFFAVAVALDGFGPDVRHHVRDTASIRLRHDSIQPSLRWTDVSVPQRGEAVGRGRRGSTGEASQRRCVVGVCGRFQCHGATANEPEPSEDGRSYDPLCE